MDIDMITSTVVTFWCFPRMESCYLYIYAVINLVNVPTNVLVMTCATRPEVIYTDNLPLGGHIRTR